MLLNHWHVKGLSAKACRLGRIYFVKYDLQCQVVQLYRLFSFIWQAKEESSVFQKTAVLERCTKCFSFLINSETSLRVWLRTTRRLFFNNNFSQEALLLARGMLLFELEMLICSFFPIPCSSLCSTRLECFLLSQSHKFWCCISNR